MILVDIYRGQKLIAKSVKYCQDLRSKVIGLMFVSSPGNGAFLPNVKDIHMNFVRFNLDIIWLDKDNVVVKKALARPWKLYYGPANATHVLELPQGCGSSLKIGDTLYIKNRRKV
ncbi:DUF192 domain-containing protein [Candidatus Parvarchaeota archaeon]|uniref:DUF192 domain-containing protein n=1 Tax=Candidatus Acidifodinimicrobium mancum TaxID=2898728 RepID=A0A8T3URB6_9ARCH|nr:DUF192 domain-containing protein [Candidatus Acidifodinimicrobium mancum]MBE5729560.1 DUF192 domain-containing protein [Candidatus Acidifodinimicrobium mancum]MBE5729762.1 DUF192 domain-containing protein [Candidatus Acidifodinimicrobium mancum]